MRHGEALHIDPLRSVAGCEFGASQVRVQAQLLQLEPAQVAPTRVNYDGEVELFVGLGIFRFRQDRLVECTFPDRPERCVRPVIDGAAVLSMYEWLGAREDCTDIALFRVARSVGIAYDRRAPEHHSFTLFAPGHWDGLF